jgi:hypothetical protein
LRQSFVRDFKIVLGAGNFSPTKGFLDRDRMQPFALMFILCALVISSTAAADQTCKAKATEQRLAGSALLSFVKQCEVQAQMAYAEVGRLLYYGRKAKSSNS